MFIVFLALLFIIRLRFPPHRSLYSTVLSRYDVEGLHALRDFEKVDYKLKKTRADLRFLECCLQNGLCPRFLQFKTYSKNVSGLTEYRNYQKKLLQGEISSKKELLLSHERRYNSSYQDFKEVFSYFDFNHVTTVIKNTNSKKIAKVTETHNRKLSKLGMPFSYEPLNPDSLIFNLSNRILTKSQKEALSLGLDFAFAPTRLDYNRYFVAVENLFKRLSACEVYNVSIDAYNLFRTKFKSVALQTFYSFNPRPSPYQKQLLKALRELRSSNDIVVTKPDKGKAAVIMDREDYITKMTQLLSDTRNFKRISEDLYKYLLKLEDRNNRIVDGLTKSGSMTSAQGSELKSRGARPGILYGLPKIHKPDVPMRPILSTTGSFNYSMSRYLVSLLSSLCDNEFLVKDSFQFVRDII